MLSKKQKAVEYFLIQFVLHFGKVMSCTPMQGFVAIITFRLQFYITHVLKGFFSPVEMICIENPILVSSKGCFGTFLFLGSLNLDSQDSQDGIQIVPGNFLSCHSCFSWLGFLLPVRTSILRILRMGDRWFGGGLYLVISLRLVT